MPPHNSGGDELSLRHLPDVSDTSFSFQIPGSVLEENLLAEDDQEFFRGVYVSPTAPSPPTNTNEPLTLSQLTPRPTHKKQAPQNQDRLSSFPTLSYHQQDADQLIPKTRQQKPPSRVKCPEVSNTNGKGTSKPRPKVITPSIPHLPSTEGSPAGARLEAIKAEVDLLAEDELIQSSNAGQELDITGTQRPKGLTKTSLEKIQPHFREEKRERPARTKQRVFEGGITKTKAMDKPSERAAHMPSVNADTMPIFSPPQQSRRSKDLYGDGESMTDTTVSSMSTDGGVAARLVQYSQKLISSFGILNSDVLAGTNVPLQAVQASATWDPETGTNTNYAQLETDTDSDMPLTLSQLSPRKNAFCPVSETLTPPASVPISPLRSSSKRPASVASEVYQRKKNRTDASTAAGGVAQNRNSDMNSKPKKVQHASSQTHPKSNTVSGPSRPKPTKPITGERGISKRKTSELAKGTTITRHAPAFKPRSKETNDDAPVRHASESKSISTSTSSSSSTSKLRISRQRSDHTIEPVNSLSVKGKGKMTLSSGSVSSTSAKPAFHIPVIPLHATKPVEFHLYTSSRSETRIKGQSVKEGNDSQSQTRSQRDKKHHLDIPDFKVLHAAQDAKLALLKENIHPTVPLPIKWETDHRVKERQKFDEMVREKEREQERLMEEKRREKEEQEEREVRELRKKAIPKAHEVPEWYKEAPKKKDKTVGAIGR